MDMLNEDWLPHISPEVASEVKGNYLDAYLIALEGWRRGLTLKWHIKNAEAFKDMKTWFVDHPGQLFTLESPEKKHYFFRTRGDKVTNDAVEKAMNKTVTKQIMVEKSISVPKGMQFTKNTKIEKVIQFANDIGYPVVVKPVDGSFGRGVFTEIKDRSELTHILQYVQNEAKEQSFIIEQHVYGKDYRLYVVDGQVVGAILRLPANVVGDGINTLESLIEIKNNERLLNPRLMDCLIKIDNDLIRFVEKQGYTLDQVIEKDHLVHLSDKANISIGGDPIGVLNSLDEKVKQVAVQALQAVEGLPHGAVDIMYDEEKQEAYVIELNPTSQLGGILFPLEGKSSDIPAAIIDYYFPETKEVVTDKHKMYFDFFEVIEPLVSRQSIVTTVTPALLGTIHMRKYSVFGEVTNLGYHLGLRKQAFERNLHGFVDIINENEIEIIVAGLEKEMVDDFENGITEDEERAVVLEISKTDYNGYVKVGFDPRANIKVLEQDLNEMVEELDDVRTSIRQLEVEKRKLLQSTSWKVTKPIRTVGAIFKKK